MTLPQEQIEYRVWNTEDLWQRGVEAAHNAYNEMRLHEQDVQFLHEVHTLPYCIEWTTRALARVGSEMRLFDRQAAVERMEFRAEDGKIVPRLHQFLRVILTDFEQPRYLDGTWQQLLPEQLQHSFLPKVLAGTLEQITEIAKSAGVPEDRLALWTTAGAVETRYRR